MSGIHEWIYSWSEGAGSRFLKFLLLLLAVTALGVVYNLRAYKCFGAPEAMDMAQLGRNLATGKGYTTQCIRPFSLYLVQKRVSENVDNTLRSLPADRQTWNAEQKARMEEVIRSGQLTEPHPDITNPPVYPYLLSTLMQWAPLNFAIPGSEPFARYQPELMITILNQALFFLVVWLTFSLGRKLFDDGVAWISAVILMGTDLFWRFSVAGLSTMLLLVFFLGLVWCLIWLEEGATEFWGSGRMLGLAVLCGMLLGVGTLTRYAFAWMGLPVLVFIMSFLGVRRVFLGLVILLVAGGIVAPWLARNYEISGALFGTASFVIHEGTPVFPTNHLLRALNPDFSYVDTLDIPVKLVTNLRVMLANDLPKLGGSWISAFFLVGLLVPFKNPSLARLRVFAVLSLGLFVVVQALGRTPMGAEAGEITHENLLILFAPLIFLFGTGLFYTVLDQARASVWEARSLIHIIVITLGCAPLLVTLLPPRTYSLAYPPYSPPVIQSVSRWMLPSELMMSDIPWAVAWYGDRTCIWLPINSQGDFETINKQRAVKALYLTPQTMDNRFLTQWIEGENQGWGEFIAQSLLRREVPTGFPLVKAYGDLFPAQLFLTDRERWKQ